MVFSSYVFLFVFLPLTLAFYYAVPRRGKAYVLIVASCIFYGWWRPDFVVLMFVSAIVDFVAGQRISKDQQRGRTGKAWLVSALTIQLGLLAYFKYANFAVASINSVLGWTDSAPVAWTEVILPIGISFYTFKTMSYTIDVYFGRVARIDSFVNFLCYVTLFPELVAGPIVRYISVEDQLKNRTHSFDKFFQGIVAFQAGLAKKLLIADVLGPVADSVFASHAPTTPEAWLGVVAYAFQIYFDFSGYSDMAIGLGLMFGFRFPINFDKPYRSLSITEFWRRWHISLSTWLRDYLYVPLGGNRKGEMRTYVNLMVTMLLGGLWHGANWTFIAWGAYQGIWLVLERLNGKRPLWWRAPRAAQMAVTFVVTLGGWVFFRAATLPDAGRFFVAMFSFRGLTEPLQALDLRPLPILMFGVAAVAAWVVPTTQALMRRMQPAFTLAMQPAFVLAICQIFYLQNVPFLYYQF